MKLAVRDSVPAIIGTVENDGTRRGMNFGAGSVSLPADAGGWLRGCGVVGEVAVKRFVARVDAIRR